MNYDVIIIGAGPGGIFAAYELMKKLSILTEKYLLIHLGREFKTLEFYKSLGN